MSEWKLQAPKGSSKKKKIIGRGAGSGKGGRCGRGNKGQNARSGGGVRLGFEGGQMPLYRRIARRGFSNKRFAKPFAVVNIGELEKKFRSGDTVNRESLYRCGLVSKKGIGVKVLGIGGLTKKLTLEVDGISRSAAEAVQKAGGRVVGGRAEEKEKKENAASEKKPTIKAKEPQKAEDKEPAGKIEPEGDNDGQ
jgi:large subunit ribosomal protein L15